MPRLLCGCMIMESGKSSSGSHAAAQWGSMLRRTATRVVCVTLLLALGAQAATAAAPGNPPLKTRNVVLIVSDGLRWQEVFTGADPLLMNEKNGGIWDKESDLRREFWRTDPDERRKALFPFLWSTVATRGQIFGNQAKGSIARVTNGVAFSYPGLQRDADGPPGLRASTRTSSARTPTPPFLNGSMARRTCTGRSASMRPGTPSRTSSTSVAAICRCTSAGILLIAASSRRGRSC